MSTTLFVTGLACLIAAVTGGGLRAFGIEAPLLHSLQRQVILGLVGTVLIIVSVVTAFVWNAGAPRFEGVVKDVSNIPIPDVLKEDCQRLVEGQLVFAPSVTMRQGSPYPVSARLSRGTDARITTGLDGKAIVIQNTLVSCMVSMTLDSQEPSAFKFENIPSGRKDEQILLANAYTQWDWRVTPLKSGTLRLLLYVTPMLYVDGVGQGLKQFPQPPRVITVSPDYVFVIENLVIGHWEVSGTLLTAIIVVNGNYRAIVCLAITPVHELAEQKSCRQKNCRI